MRRYQHLIIILLGTIALTLAACQRSEEPPAKAPAPAAKLPDVQAPAAAPVQFRVSGIELGKQLRDDKRVAEQVAVFAPADTIYATVVSEGTAPQVTLKAKWTYEGGQLVSETSQTIAPTGPAATEFHISKASGWPAGKYTVEIAANDTPVGSKQFEVR